MTRLTIQQVRGLKDLIQEGVEAGVNSIEQVHQTIAKQPYAVLKRIDAIAAPVQTVEQVQQVLTGRVYSVIRTVNRVAGAVATQVLNRLEKREDSSNNP